MGIDLLPASLDPDNIVAENPGSLLAAIVDSCEDAIISKDLKGKITSWNLAAERMFGYRPEEVIGKSILVLIPPDLHEEEAGLLKKLVAGNRIEHHETVRVTKTGERLDLSLTISPIRDGMGNVIGASKIAHDISLRKKMEALLLQSEKIATAGRMAATIAHEINNPLEAVMNLVYLARQSSSADSDAHRYLVTAENEVERVSRIARSTLGYYRDQGTPSEVYLRELMEDSLEVFASKLTGRRIAIESSYCQSRPILVSKGEMMQVFSNIISNSIDAMHHGGLLRIGVAESTGSNGDGLQVTIEDNGTGIDEQHIAKIFEPFFTTKPDVGTGIGLWVTKRMIESRGGQIAVSSCTTPGNSGSQVTIDLPYAA
jgi:PAS domain S-box-containing protein